MTAAAMEEQATAAILQATSLTFLYRRSAAPAIDRLSFCLQPGELCGLIGPNGAGKTTLISVLTTLLRPASGTLTICGNDACGKTSRIRRFLGVAPQDLALYDRLTGLENLLYFARLYGLSDRQARDRSARYLDLFGLTGKAGCRVSTYSGGMKRRLNLIAGLLHEPRILFLDEPTAGVDAQSRHLIIDRLAALNASGMTMVYTSHYLEEIQRLCSRVVIIDHGRIVVQGTTEDLIDQQEGCTSLADLYLRKTGETLRN